MAVVVVVVVVWRPVVALVALCPARVGVAVVDGVAEARELVVVAADRV